MEAAKFSASYVVAYSLVHGAPRIPAFTEQALKDERVKALAQFVTASGDPELSDAFGESPAKLKITLKDGQTFEHAARLRDRLEAGADDAGATRRQVHGLRRASGQRRYRQENPGIVEHVCGSAFI